MPGPEDKSYWVPTPFRTYGTERSVSNFVQAFGLYKPDPSTWRDSSPEQEDAFAQSLAELEQKLGEKLDKIEDQ